MKSRNRGFFLNHHTYSSFSNLRPAAVQGVQPPEFPAGMVKILFVLHGWTEKGHMLCSAGEDIGNHQWFIIWANLYRQPLGLHFSQEIIHSMKNIQTGPVQNILAISTTVGLLLLFFVPCKKITFLEREKKHFYVEGCQDMDKEVMSSKKLG